MTDHDKGEFTLGGRLTKESAKLITAHVAKHQVAENNVDRIIVMMLESFLSRCNSSYLEIGPIEEVGIPFAKAH